MRKKGQAAMEFLMTYGWAILAAIIVIGVLAIYFRPSQLTPTNVIVTAPLFGEGATMNTTTIQVEFRNQAGEALTTTAASVSFNTPTDGTCSAGTGVGVVNASGTQIISFPGCNLASGDTVSADLSISYTTPDTSLAQTSTGSVSGTVA